MLFALLIGIHSSTIADATIHTEEQCLASVIYYEANRESLKGKRAVLDVVLNRMRATGKSACEVIKARKQFSWYPKKPIKRYNNEMQNLLTSVRSTSKVLINERYQFFHKTSVKPKWAINMDCRKVGRHYFCKERR